MKSFLTRVLPLFSYLAFIFFLSSREEPNLNLPFPQADKGIHFILYIPLLLLVIRFLRGNLKKNVLLASIIFSLLYAASDEWHQSFVPTRKMDFFDFLADALGIMSGVIIFQIISKLKKNTDSH